MPVWICNNELSKGSEVIIFDLDGVISDAAHRQHFLKRTERDWDCLLYTSDAADE